MQIFLLVEAKNEDGHWKSVEANFSSAKTNINERLMHIQTSYSNFTHLFSSRGGEVFP